MYKYSILKSFLCLCAAIAISGCRSAKPVASYESMADSMAVMTESVIRETEDSMSISETTKVLVEDAVEFVDGGGTVYVCSDGSVILSGITEVRSSRHGVSENRTDRKTLSEQIHSKDSVASIHQSSTHFELQPTASSSKWSWTNTGILMAVLLLIIALIIRKNWRNKI